MNILDEIIGNSPKPKIGDYVICEEDSDFDMFDNFLKNNIGQIIEISEPNFTGLERYNIKYDILCNMPREITYFFNENKRFMYIYEIKQHSSNIEDLKHILQANKYNL